VPLPLPPPVARVVEVEQVRMWCTGVEHTVYSVSTSGMCFACVCLSVVFWGGVCSVCADVW